MATKIEELLETISKMTVLEISELVKSMEEKFGVSAVAAPVVVANGAESGAEQQKAEEQTEFSVVLKGLAEGANKISVIKAVRSLVPGLGLKEAKDLVEAGDKPVREGVSKQDADKAKKDLEEAGAVVVLQ